MPITFLEALAEGTPIVSYVDPDGYVTKFGIKTDYNIDAFVSSIETAISERLYENIGCMEREYALKEHDVNIVMDKHIQLYKQILEQ